MTAASWLILIGGVMQVAGVAVTFTGATRTWNEFSPDERLFADEMRRTRSLVHSIYVRFRAFIRMPLPAHISSVEGEATIRFGGRGNLTISYSAIDPDDDVLNILQDLDRRTRELRDETNRISGKLFKELPELQRRIVAVEKQLAESIASLEHQDRLVATGGIKAVLAGLVLVGAGVVIQSASIFVPA